MPVVAAFLWGNAPSKLLTPSMWASVDKAQNRLKKPRLLATAWSCLLKSYVYKSKMSSLFAAQAENGVVTRWIRLR